MKSTVRLKERVKQQENFWKMKLETLPLTWSEPRPKLNSFHADFLFTSIIFRFCIWFKIIDVSCKMTLNILQHL